MLPVENKTRKLDDDVLFVLPTRYAGLTSEPSSLAGEVTVVGKILHMDLARDRRVATDRGRLDGWTDRETVRQFGQALVADRALELLSSVVDDMA